MHFSMTTAKFKPTEDILHKLQQLKNTTKPGFHQKISNYFDQKNYHKKMVLFNLKKILLHKKLKVLVNFFMKY